MVSSTVTSASASASASRARVGISLFFFTNGAFFAGMLPRYPEVKHSLELSNTAFGLAIVAFPLGAMSASMLPSLFIRKIGARMTALLWTVVLGAFMCLAAIGAQTGAVWLFVGSYFVAGLSDAIVDTGQNSHAMRVQEAYGRSIINSLHALWSAGSIVGGLLGTAAAALAVPIAVHIGVVSAACIALAVYATDLCKLPERERRAWREPRASPGGTARSRVWTLMPLAIIGIASMQVEVVGMDWSANYMNGPVGWSVRDAGVAYVVLMASQFAGRLVGDPATDRWGRLRVARGGMAMVAVGLVLAAVVPVAWAALGGFALVGFGCATLVPATFAAADAAPGFEDGTALTAVSWFMRIGTIFASPAVGVIGDAFSLRLGILLPLVLGSVAWFYLSRLERVRPDEAVSTALAAEEARDGAGG